MMLLISMIYSTFTIPCVAFTDTQSAARRARRGEEVRFCLRTRVLRRSTKGSPSGGEGEADSEAVGHVAVAT